MELKTLLGTLENNKLLVESRGDLEGKTVEILAHDSRKVGKNGLFVAIRGDHVDGHLFIDKAVINGAVAVVCERTPPQETSVPVTFRVTDSRAALADLAGTFYGRPSLELHLIGVTGTNGKTTTAILIQQALEALGATSGLLGTIEWRLGDRIVEATHTTPDALELNKLLREMKSAGCSSVVMEVSSHALDQQRVRGQRYSVGVFTNLTRDHLDYHGTLEDYISAKKRLFDGLDANAVAVYNSDDPVGPEMVANTAAKKVSYGATGGAQIRVETLEDDIGGLVLRIDGIVQRFKLVGGFNAMNLGAAYGAITTLGYAGSEVMDALGEVSPAPGRFEQVLLGQDIGVIVDYAHTPDALENVLRTLRRVKAAAANVWCVFGCGGDRDRGKRPVMGSIAERYAERVVVTSDNPRTEDPEKIMDDIRAGMVEPDRAEWIPQRREAIHFAIAEAKPGDIVLIAGKGHEPYQIVGTEKRHFDDREEALKGYALRAEKRSNEAT